MNQRNTAASVRARLLSRARETRQDFNASFEFRVDAGQDSALLI